MTENHTSRVRFDGGLGRYVPSGIRLPLALSLLNQFIGGGGNFLINVYLARTLALGQFGVYGIGFGICMLYVGVGNAVILTQMIVNMPDKIDTEKIAYAESMLFSLCLMSVSFFVLSAIGAAFAWVILPGFARFLPSVFAVVLAAIALLAAEFFICHAFLRRREHAAVAVNALTMLTILSGFGTLRLCQFVLTGDLALLLYATGASVSAFVAYRVSPLRLRVRQPKLIENMTESWIHGRWALGGVALTWLQTQTYAYVLAFYLGPTGIGQANAARIFISPFNFILTSINKVAIPRLVELRDVNPHEMFRVSFLLTTGLLALTTLYSLILLGNVERVSNLVLGRHDPAIVSIVWIWCLLLIVQMARSCGGILLQVQRKFRLLMLANIPSVIITALMSAILIYLQGVGGAVLGLLAGEVVLALLIWREIRNERAEM